MKVFKTIMNILVVLFAVLGFALSAFWVYFHFFIKPNQTTTGVNNISDQVGLDVSLEIKNSEDLTPEEELLYKDRWFMHANYYSNDKNNGLEVQELNFNYFEGFDLTTDEYRSTGMQFIGDFETYLNHSASLENTNIKVLDEFYYYDTTNQISWNGSKGQTKSIATILNRNQEFNIKIDNRLFSIKLDGGYVVEHGKTGFGRWFYNLIGYRTEHYFDYGDLFDCVFTAIKSNSQGYGDYYIKLDLSQFFSIKEFDSSTGKFKSDDVTDIIKNYAVLKFHYDENGLASASQSLFKSVECNSKYGLDSEVDTTYWQPRVVYNIDESDLSYRFSDVDGAYFAYLDLEKKDMISNLDRAKINVSIDLDSKYLSDKKINVLGIDFKAFEDVEVETLTISGSSEKFYLLDNCFKDSNLQVLNRSSSITLYISESAINSDYVEVVL